MTREERRAAAIEDETDHQFVVRVLGDEAHDRIHNELLARRDRRPFDQRASWYAVAADADYTIRAALDASGLLDDEYVLRTGEPK